MSTKKRYGFDDDPDDLYYTDEAESDGWDNESDDEEGDDDLDLPAGHSTGETSVEISMEVDESGNEVWFAGDARIPGSSSMGHSLEEAMEGVEERRRQYREVLRKSREERARQEETGRRMTGDE
jgi:predicted RNase H-like HicB family nuclease